MPKTQTIIRYGAVEINHVHTVDMDQEAVWDEAGVNLIGTKFTVTAAGLIHNATSIVQPQTTPIDGSATTPVIEREIRYLIMKPRQTFSMTVGADSEDSTGGEPLLVCLPAPFARNEGEHLSSPPNLFNMDINNGPKCTRLDITHLTAEVFRVDFTFEIVKAPECDRNGQNFNNSGILSITWSLTDDHDKNTMTTRTWEGQIRSATAKVNPHSFRGYAVPVLHPGMRRERMKFTSSPDGLLLNFEIRDSESYASPPPPATSWANGGLKYTVTTGDGKKTFVDCSCGLQGDRFADRKLLVTLATAIVQARIFAFEVNGNAERKKIKPVLEFFAISEHLDDNNASVFVSARAHRPVIGLDAAAVTKAVLGEDAKLVTQKIQVDGVTVGNIPEFKAWDTRLHRGNWKGDFAGAKGRPTGSGPETQGNISVESAFSTHLQTACSSNREISSGVPAVDSTPRKVKPKGFLDQLEFKDIKEQPPRALRVSREHAAAPYTTWRMQSTYKSQQHVVAMPIARFSGGGSLSSEYLPSVSNIVLAPPTTVMRTRVDAVRVGAKPLMPEGKSFQDPQTGISYTLLEYNILSETPDQRPGGDIQWTTAVELVYSCSRRPQPFEEVVIGRNPWDRLGIQRTSTAETQDSGNAFFGGTNLT